MTALAPAQIGDYEILADLHSGGMGSVSLARKRGAHGFEKLVAIKSVRRELRSQAEIRALFMNEARLVARLAHPSIAQVHDFAEDGDAAYLVMEYVEGVGFGELPALCGGAMPAAVACQAMAQVCRGLHAAHELTDVAGAPLQVVHRDISPHNLMLTFDGKVKILDFGIARSRLRDGPVTAIGDVRGKPGYMAPEQLTGGDIDRRTDVFLAGLVLHELLTGRRLFEAKSFMAAAHALMNQPIDAPSRWVSLSPELDALVMKALAREPDERFASAATMAEALEQVAAGASLESFAASTLAAARRVHAEALRAMLSGAATAPGRRADIDTVTAPPPRQSKVPPAALAVLALGLVAALAWWRLQPDEPLPQETSPLLPVSTAAAAPAEAPQPEPSARDPEPVGHDGASDAAAAAPHPLKRQALASKSRAASAAAYLTVGAEPYAIIRINGEDIGPTPIFDRLVPTGRLDVELLAPDTRALRLRRRLSLTAGEHAQLTFP